MKNREKQLVDKLDQGIKLNNDERQYMSSLGYTSEFNPDSLFENDKTFYIYKNGKVTWIKSKWSWAYFKVWITNKIDKYTTNEVTYALA